MMKRCRGGVFAVVLTLLMVFGSVASPLTGLSDVYADSGKWIYVDGQSGSDSNDGSSAGSAVKTWDKAKSLLGCEEGGIYVVGTVDASGEISTKNPAVQTVKRNSDIVMFNVGSEAIFANIDVGGENKSYNSPAIKPASNAKLYFLENAKFHNIGYVEDSAKNDAKAGAGMGQPDNEYGGMVCLVVTGVNILVDGAEFYDNNGKGVFFAPIQGGDMGPKTDSLIMKSGKVTGNKLKFGLKIMTDCRKYTMKIM